MRNATRLPRLAAAAALVLALAAAPLRAHAASAAVVLAAAAQETPAPDPAAEEGALPAVQPGSESTGEAAPQAGSEQAMVYIGEVATQVEGAWEGGVTFAVGSSAAKTYATMTGNILRLTLYSTVAEDASSWFYLPMDSHISYIDGTDRFAMTGRSGRYYCYEKGVRVTAGGDFSLTAANSNGTLYSGLYDTVSVHAYDTIETLDFFAEQNAGDASQTDFFVAANGSPTALLTPDTLGFNATDNEWKIVTPDGTERVLFSDTAYAGYAFDPRTISLTITAGEQADADAGIQVYYLGLINGRLFTVGPYAYPASASTYSRTFVLAHSEADVLAAENTVTVYAYIEAGRRPDLTVTEANGLVSLGGVETVESDREGLDRLAVTLNVLDTANDLDVLIGNRWSSSETAYNYRTLRLRFLHQVQSVNVTAAPSGYYRVVYSAAVNGQQELDTRAVNWYINGVLQPEHGLTLDHTYNEGGSYAVYAELGGVSSNTVTNTIIFADWQATLWYTALVVAIAAAVLYLLRSHRLRGARRDSVIRARLQHLLAQAQNAQAALQQGRIPPRRAARALGRGLQLAELQDDLRLRYRLTNMAAYDQAVKALETARGDLRRASRRRADDAYYVRALLSTYAASLSKALDALDEIAALAAMA